MTELANIRDKIEAAAENLGATRSAIFKWRKRGVPAEWKLKLIAGGFTVADIACAEAMGTRTRINASAAAGNAAQGPAATPSPQPEAAE